MFVFVSWRNSTASERLKFIFKVLDNDKDDMLSAVDMAVMLSAFNRVPFKIGDRAVSRTDDRKCGVTKYVGSVEGNSGNWVGLELDEPLGKHDGTINGKSYFTAGKDRGLMADPSTLVHETLVKTAKDILSKFSGNKDKVSIDIFTSKMLEESWLLPRIMQDPFPSALKIQ